MAASDSEISAYITSIRVAVTEFGNDVAKKQMLGKRDILCDRIKLMLLSGYLDCIIDYFLQSPYSSNNLFTTDEIHDVMQHINNICGTNYILSL